MTDGVQMASWEGDVIKNKYTEGLQDQLTTFYVLKDLNSISCVPVDI